MADNLHLVWPYAVLTLFCLLPLYKTFNRELKNSLVEISELVDILKTKSRIADGTQALPAVAPSVQALRNRLVSMQMSSNGSSSSSSSSSGASNGHHTLSEHSLGHAGQQLSVASASSSHDVQRSTDGHHWAGVASTSGSAPHSRSAPYSLSELASLDASSTGVEIELRDVHFGYSSDRKILNGLSLRVLPGQSVAIVGPSGSGKSTVLKLLTRQYDVTQGSLLLNGCEMRDLTLDSLRAAVAVVPQDTVLFNDSIMENIRCAGQRVFCGEYLHGT